MNKIKLFTATIIMLIAVFQVYGFGGREEIPPDVRMSESEQQFISPGNADGVQDRVVVDVSVSPAKRRVIKGYRLMVTDRMDSVVYSLEESDPSRTRKPIVVPVSLTWDGSMQDGSGALEGTYRLFFECRDNRGATGVSQSLVVTIDNTPPAAQIAAPYTVFSPNSDGNQDILVIEQSGTAEQLWTGRFFNNSGNELLRLTWANQVPDNFTWSGFESEGQPFADGTYRYEVSATDRAGNSAKALLENIVIDNRDTPIALSIDTRFFSPNNDGVLDMVLLIPKVPVSAGIRDWELSVLDRSKIARRLIKGTEVVPKEIVFDGNNQEGIGMEEGLYTANLEVNYLNGNRPTASSPSFELDLTPPSVTTGTDLRVFSPNGDGNKDSVTITQSVSEELEWVGTISDSSGRGVNSFTWKGRPESSWQWTGTGTEGALLPDGVYTYRLTATDRAGNSVSSKPLNFELNTEKTDVLISVDLDQFSPNDDGVKDRLRLMPNLKVTEGVENYELLILNSQDQPIRSFRGSASVPSELIWDGSDNDGNRLPDGSYVGELRVLYTKGDYHVVRTPAFLMDNRAPEIELSTDYTLFSPDGDTRRDSVIVKQRSSKEDTWEGRIVSAGGEVVRSFIWNGLAGDMTWDGADEHGNRVADGVYSYQISATDRAGNVAAAELPRLRVDTRPISLVISASDTALSPNGDGFRDNVSFSLYVSPQEEVVSWNLTILNKGTREGKQFSGTEKIPASLVWDGRTSQGAVAEGLYAVTFRVAYLKGTIAEVTADKELLVDVSSPAVKVTVSPLPFSPDNDGINDTLQIQLEAADASTIDAWNMTILDPAGHEFFGFAGKGLPDRPVAWDGRSDKGEVVEAAQDYTANLSVRDSLGNISYSKTVIPVDVLVVRDGNRLKIRVSSIQFAPNTADFSSYDPEAAAKNRQTLQRLADILNKYSTYKILIEGHATRVYWDNETLAQKEERDVLVPLSAKRAEAVKNALVGLGIKAERISTVGLGGSQPVVPHGDLENRWKNRRVEFILVEDSR